MISFTKYSKLYYIFSGIIIAISIASLVLFGLKFGIEFNGGSSMEVEFLEKKPNNDEISKALSDFNLGEIVIQPIEEKGVILRFKVVDENNHLQILAKLKELAPLEEKSFQYIGPSIGEELKFKTIIASVLTLLAIATYVSFAFRKVSKPVSSFKYGIATLIALFHDLLIPLGVFSILGKFYNVEITIPIIAALLTIVGYSVHDTIIVFDRIRENIFKRNTESFSQIVDASLNQTLGRSITTTATILLVMIALFIFGGQTLKNFSLALIIGISAGTYSSIFIASALLVTWEKLGKNKNI